MNSTTVAMPPHSAFEKLEFDMIGPAPDTYTMDFSLCTSTTTTTCVGGKKPN